MVSVVDAAKRELVKLLRSLALVYSVVFSVTRDSADADVLKCFKQVSRKAHPDKGGKLEHQKALNAARDKWEAAAKDAKGTHGGGKRRKPELDSLMVALLAKRLSNSFDSSGFSGHRQKTLDLPA